MDCYEFKSELPECYEFTSHLIEDCYTFVSNINPKEDDPIIVPEKPPFIMRKIPYLPRPVDVDTTRMYMDGIWCDGTYIYILYRWFDDDNLSTTMPGAYLSRFTYSSSLFGMVSINEEWNTYEGDNMWWLSPDGLVEMTGYSPNSGDSSGFFKTGHYTVEDTTLTFQTPFLSDGYPIPNAQNTISDWLTPTIAGSWDIKRYQYIESGCVFEGVPNRTTYTYSRGINVNTGEIETVYDYAAINAYPLEDDTYVHVDITLRANGDFFMGLNGVLKATKKNEVVKLRDSLDDTTPTCENVNHGWFIPIDSDFIEDMDMFILSDGFLAMGKKVGGGDETTWEIYVVDLSITDEDTIYNPIEREVIPIDIEERVHSFAVFQDNIIYTVFSDDEDRPENERQLSTYIHQVSVSDKFEDT